MENQFEEDKRRKIRVEFRTQVFLTVGASEIHVEGSSRDLSLNGIFIRTEESIPVESKCNVKVILSGMDDGLSLQMQGCIVRNDSSGVAVTFTSMDVDSYTHLKNVVKYNVSNPDEVE